MAAAPRARKSPPPPPPHPARGWVLGIAATLIATAAIQGVRYWSSVDAYDDEVKVMLEPVQKQAAEAQLGVDKIATELATSRLQSQKNAVDTDIYKLEKSKEDAPDKWNARDDLRLKELMDAQEKVTSKLEAVVP